MTDVHAPQAKHEPSDVEGEAVHSFGISPVEAAGGGAGGTAEPPETGAGWLRWAWRQLTSMRTALILLFLLAIASIPGSVLPQQGLDPAAVQQYYTSHPSLAPLMNHLGLFNVFATPWFAAIYLLLFASLVGCVVPRTFRLAGAARTPPPRAPRNLRRLPHSASSSSGLGPAQAVEQAAAVLGGQRFRLRRSDPAGPDHWVSAEKGYLREVGNLVFHLALLGVLISIAVGGLFGYKADKLLVEGQTFADTSSSLDEFHPGRLVSGSDLAPFTLTLKSFTAQYLTSGASRGQPSNFDADVSYAGSPGGAVKDYHIRINDPLSVDSLKVYLIGHGYAPEFKVTGANGRVFEADTPFIPANTGTFLSDGVVKAPDESLGFEGVFVPTAISVSGTLDSIFPAPDNPAVSLVGYSGNLGMDSGVPQSVYQLDTSAMTKISSAPHMLLPGQTWKLPDGKGSIQFVGVKQWASLAITYDPGQVPALVCGILALAGLLLSFFVRRRRVFVRAVAAPSGPGSVVTVGGLTRSDAGGGFEEEFAELSAEIAAAVPPGATAPPAGPTSGGPTSGGPTSGGTTSSSASAGPSNQSETGA